jgi:hypothetical protein
MDNKRSLDLPKMSDFTDIEPQSRSSKTDVSVVEKTAYEMGSARPLSTNKPLAVKPAKIVRDKAYSTQIQTRTFEQIHDIIKRLRLKSQATCLELAIERLHRDVLEGKIKIDDIEHY